MSNVVPLHAKHLVLVSKQAPITDIKKAQGLPRIGQTAFVGSRLFVFVKAIEDLPNLFPVVSADDPFQGKVKGLPVIEGKKAKEIDKLIVGYVEGKGVSKNEHFWMVASDELASGLFPTWFALKDK